ncbi:ParA family protein [Limosilactobacillus reuteri]|uniref:ParA family protein n=1 Tax=Limosilactobacillus reuteri TaxID=1598 RepID=UPI0039909382
MSTLLFYNFKGGVGKTTISVLAADHLSRSGKKVLLIDLDAQASATLFLKTAMVILLRNDHYLIRYRKNLFSQVFVTWIKILI